MPEPETPEPKPPFPDGGGSKAGEPLFPALAEPKPPRWSLAARVIYQALREARARAGDSTWRS